MPSRYLYRGPTARAAQGLPGAAPIYVDSDDNKIKFIPAGSGTTEVEVLDASSAQTLTSKTLTAPVINNPSGTVLSEVVAAANVIAAAESGSTFYLNSAVEFVSTLPAPAIGLKFTFIVSAAPAGASYTVICAAAGTLIKGHVLSNDLNAAADADFGIAGELTLTFVDGKAVAGDRADFECDGTNWFVRASCSVFDAITIS